MTFTHITNFPPKIAAVLKAHCLPSSSSTTKKLVLFLPSGCAASAFHLSEKKSKALKLTDFYTTTFCFVSGSEFLLLYFWVIVLNRFRKSCWTTNTKDKRIGRIHLCCLLFLNEDVICVRVVLTLAVLIPSNDLSCIPLHNRPIKAASYVVPSSCSIFRAAKAAAVGLSSLRAPEKILGPLPLSLDARKGRWPTSYKIPPHWLNETSIDDNGMSRIMDYLVVHAPYKGRLQYKEIIKQGGIDQVGWQTRLSDRRPNKSLPSGIGIW